MATKRFLVSVGDVVAMAGNNIVFTAKTLTDSTIEVTTSSTEIRGGVSNALQAVYYHDSAFNITLTDTQFKLPYIQWNTGAGEATVGANMWKSEAITLTGKQGTITSTPAAVNGQTPAVWIEIDGEYQTIEVDTTARTFSLEAFPSIAANSTVCVSYLTEDAAAKTITIPASFIPGRLRLFITANLYGDTSGDGFVGKVQIEVPVAQLSGAQTISMTADGYSTTPLSAMALAYTDGSVTGCQSTGYYAKITESLNGAAWSDGVTALAIAGGDFGLANGATQKLAVYAVRSGTSFLCDNAKLTFTHVDSQGGEGTSDTVVQVSADGVVSGIGAGTSLITAKIAGTSIEASCTVTVSA